MFLRLSQLKNIIQESFNKTMWPVKNWGFTHISWPQFVKQYPEEAAEFVAFYTENFSEEEFQDLGGTDHTKWHHLYDDEVFLNRDGVPLIYGNITSPGGSHWMKRNDKFGWEEVSMDDEGNEAEIYRQLY